MSYLSLQFLLEMSTSMSYTSTHMTTPLLDGLIYHSLIESIPFLHNTISEIIDVFHWRPVDPPNSPQTL